MEREGGERGSGVPGQPGVCCQEDSEPCLEQLPVSQARLLVIECLQHTV